jgi:hypothetical protein
VAIRRNVRIPTIAENSRPSEVETRSLLLDASIAAAAERPASLASSSLLRIHSAEIAPSLSPTSVERPPSSAKASSTRPSTARAMSPSAPATHSPLSRRYSS